MIVAALASELPAYKDDVALNCLRLYEFVAHQMVLAQWQKKSGKLEKEMVWPDDAKTASINYPLASR